VLPSYSENFGIAVVEAMAAGVPVVLSDQVGIHCEVTAAGAGLTVPCEVNPLADAIKQLTTDVELRCNMGKRARQLARSYYTFNAITDRLIELYIAVTAGSAIQKVQV
jgi:glycosyltransferase involved in cell wall biosynthesis